MIYVVAMGAVNVAMEAQVVNVAVLKDKRGTALVKVAVLQL